MRKTKLILVNLAVLLAVQNIFGQVNSNVKETGPETTQEQQRQQQIQKRTPGGDVTLAGLADRRAYNGQPLSKEESKALREEEKRIKALIPPAPEDLQKYKEFLRQPRTGIFLLFPDFDCEVKNVIRVDGDCANATPKISRYSFRRKEYAETVGDFFDLQLKNSDFIAKGFLSQEILVGLGDVPLENVSLESAGVKFLADFKPETENLEVRRQSAQIAEGVESAGYRYAKNVKAVENMTYALRVVAYRNKLNRWELEKSPNTDRKFFYLDYDKRIDLVLAFRVIRKDSNGGVTILWKELSHQDSPKIVFQKGEKALDIN